jgi:predicted flap endonuclease-1-like 5' DNA nuclease
MDSASEEKLAAAKITTTEQLLEAALIPAKRAALSKQTGVDAKTLTEWVNRADLMRLHGVSTEMSNLLEECGVDSCKELQNRIAANLAAKLKQVNDEKKITHHAPTLTQVEAWVKQAAELTKADAAKA